MSSDRSHHAEPGSAPGALQAGIVRYGRAQRRGWGPFGVYRLDWQVLIAAETAHSGHSYGLTPYAARLRAARRVLRLTGVSDEHAAGPQPRGRHRAEPARTEPAQTTLLGNDRVVAAPGSVVSPSIHSGDPGLISDNQAVA
jgi:hypothetical protein